MNMDATISPTEEFMRSVFRTEKRKEYELFYRGHSKSANYRLKPSLFRRLGYKDNEDHLFRELLLLNPGEFSSDAATVDKLVRMQHHSLPTRLLDITSNPLMALYFTCKSNPDDSGEVIVLKFRRKSIKFFDSDTVSCISNLAKLSAAYKRQINTALSPEEFNASHPIQMLLHFIKEEKPYFQPVIKPSDMRRVICVRTKFNNSRIASQTGASLLFGLDAKLPEEGNSEVGIERIPIAAAKKKRILRELDALNINEGTVFPYIENSAKYLAAKYKTQTGIRRLKFRRSNIARAVRPDEKSPRIA